MTLGWSAIRIHEHRLVSRGKRIPQGVDRRQDRESVGLDPDEGEEALSASTSSPGAREDEGQVAFDPPEGSPG